MQIHDIFSSHGAAAASLVAKIAAALEGHGDSVEFDEEYSIPLVIVSLHEKDAVLSSRGAVAIGAALNAAAGAEVHFHRLSGKSVEFFVFSKTFLREDDFFSENQMETCGTPFELWSQRILA